MASYKNYGESPTMQEIHRIQGEMEQQYEKSGISSYEEWLQSTEKDLRQSLSEIGYRMVIRGGRFYLYESKASSKKSNNKLETVAKVGEQDSVVISPSPKTKMIKHRNYDDYFKDSTMQEMHLIREDRAFSDKTETQPKKKHVKYKTAAKRRKMATRKKSAS
jgi:hypothetical protein